jgi:hypothetical protein
MVSHEKVFNEAMCTQDDVYLLIFPIRIFIREIRKTYTMLIVFLLNYLKGLQEFFTAYRIYVPSFFLHDFLRIIHDGLVLTIQ